MGREYPGLDDAYLRYIDATPENMRRIQSFYVPFFTDCPGPVVDLACGHGDFVQLLMEHGIEALGVDRDPDCCAEVRQRGVNIACRDVVDYLESVEENSLGGVFSAHLVEHLPYQPVMEMVRLSYRALKPEGMILLVTPNVRGLYPHLESFYMHFGHVTFYHPRLLAFFLDYFGFSDPRTGENPRMARPLWRDVSWTDAEDLDVMPPARPSVGDLQRLNRLTPVRYDATLPSQYPGVVGRWIGAVKRWAVRVLVQPLLDRLVLQINQRMDEINHGFHLADGNFESLGIMDRYFDRYLAFQRRYQRHLNSNVNATHRRLMGLDRGVECYVYATKGETTLNLAPELKGERI